MNNYTIRVLESNDYHKGFLQLLERLTIVGDISYDRFTRYLTNQNMNTTTYVIEEDIHKCLVATGTLLLEKKYTHNLSVVGHIEDIVVSKDYSGKGLGKHLMNYLTRVAEENRCYKVILNCNKDKIGFYNSCEYVEKEVEMVKYFNDTGSNR